MTHPLRLKATDPEDLAVVAACLQDALVLVDDMIYLPEERRFVLVANRFVWEEAHTRDSAFSRTTTGVIFENVTAVKRCRLDRREREGILSLLTIRALPGAIQLDFSGGAAIRLEVERIQCRLHDVGEPWPTAWRPHHELE